MNALLFAPAFAVLHLLATGLPESIVSGLSFILVQVLLSLPFTLHNARSYLARSFELSRVFLYKWSTNWKFVSEEAFLSTGFAQTLLLLHGILLLIFAWRWTEGIPLKALLTRRPKQPSADTILAAMFTCNLIGILCARSLHYQFYSWYAWTVPYLLWFTEIERPLGFLLGRTKDSTVIVAAANAIRITAWGVLEGSWLVFPATSGSSLAMLSVNLGIVAACGIWGRWT